MEWLERREVFNPLLGIHLERAEVKKEALATVFVRDLSGSIKEQHLRDFFLQFGETTQIWLSSEESLNLFFAYISYKTRE